MSLSKFKSPRSEPNWLSCWQVDPASHHTYKRMTWQISNSKVGVKKQKNLIQVFQLNSDTHMSKQMSMLVKK